MLCISLAEDASIIKNVEIAIKNKVTIIVIRMVKHAFLADFDILASRGAFARFVFRYDSIFLPQCGQRFVSVETSFAQAGQRIKYGIDSS